MNSREISECAIIAILLMLMFWIVSSPQRYQVVRAGDRTIMIDTKKGNTWSLSTGGGMWVPISK